MKRFRPRLLSARRLPWGLAVAWALPALAAADDPSAAQLVARYDHSLHAAEEGPGFREPTGVTSDPFGNVFVVDRGDHRVVQFNAKGRPTFDYGGYGWEAGEFSGPSDVCAREGFRLFVVDEGNERLQEFDIGDTSPEGAVFPFAEGVGFGGEELVRPSRVTLDSEGRVYVTDTLCHCVWIFGPLGNFELRLGGHGDAAGRFRDPGGVAVGPDGRVYVADTGNARVQVFDAIGNWTASWTGPEDARLERPVAVDVGPDGSVWVADLGTRRVEAFAPSGVPLFGFGGPGEGPGTFLAPLDLSFGPDGRLWVADAERQVVEAYVIESGPVE